MDQYNVQPHLMNATLTKEEANKNLDKAQVIGVEADALIDNKELDAVYESKMSQQKATEPVARKLMQSRTIASVMKEEVQPWNGITEYFAGWGKEFKGLLPDNVQNHMNVRRLNQLAYESSNRQLTNEEKFERLMIRDKVKEYAAKNPGLSEGGTNLNKAEGLVDVTTGALLDVPLAYVDNPKLTAGTIGAAAGVGLVTGTAIPLTVAGAYYATPLIQGYDTFQKVKGQVYEDLEFSTDVNGQPLNIPKNIVNQYATGAALASGLFDAGATASMVGRTPLFRKTVTKVIPSLAAKLAMEESGKKVIATVSERSAMSLIKAISKTAAIEGGQEGLQELTVQIMKSGALKYSDVTKEGDIVGGLSNLWGQYKAEAQKLLNEGKLTGNMREVAINMLGGAIAGPVVQGAMVGTQKAAMKVAETVSSKAKARATALRTRVENETNTRILNRLMGMQMPLEGMPRVYKGAEGQQAKIVIEEMVKMTGERELTKLRPAEANQLVADIAEQAGIPFVWIDPDDLREFSTDPKKAADVMKMLGSTEQQKATKDTQVKVRLSDALDFTRKHSEAASMFAFSPAGLSANEVLRKEAELKAYQEKIMGIVTKPEDKVEPTQEFPEAFADKKAKEVEGVVIAPDATQEDIDNMFSSREQAEAYWDKLDVEEGNLLPLYHGTPANFDKLDPSKSGGMINFAEEQSIAYNYSNGAGGGRQQPKSNNDLYIEGDDGRLDWNQETKSYEGVWDGESLSVNLSDVEEWLSENHADVKRKSARIIESFYDPSKVLDITRNNQSNQEILKKILSYLAPTNKTANRIFKMLDNGYSLSSAWWGTSKLAPLKPTWAPNINEDFQQITKIIQDAGYEGLRFADDMHITVALFNPPDQSRLNQIKELKTKIEMTIATKPSELDGLVNLQADIYTNGDSHDVQRFNEQTVIPQEVKDVMKPEQVEAIEDMSQTANEMYSEAVMDKAEKEWLSKIDQQERVALTVQREIEADNLQNDPNINIVEKFINSKNLDAQARDALGSNQKKNTPALAINPESLSVGEREQYLENETLKSRKFFDKKGMHIADVARYLDVDRADLLKIMSETKRREEAIDEAVKMKSENIVNEIASETDFDQSKIAKALNNKSKAIMNALAYYKNGDWSGFKKAIKTVVLPLPRSQDIRSKMQREVRNTRVADLNVAQYKKGEMRARKKSANAVLKGDLQEAFLHKLNELENIEGVRATHEVMGKVNRATKRVAKFFTQQVQIELERAGPGYLKAVEDIMTSFNLSPFARENVNQGAYKKLVDEMASTGQGDIALPEEIANGFDSRLNWDSLTADQYIEIVTLLDNTLQLARQKNRTIQSYTDNMRGSMMALTEEASVANLQEHPDNNPNRSEQESTNSLKDKADATLGEMEALISNTNFAVQHLDRGQLDGFWSKMIMDRIKGINSFKGVWGTEARKEMYSQVRKQWQSVIDKYGSIKFKNSGSEEIFVHQFSDIPALGNGKVKKSDLIVMATYLGNQGNIDRVTNFNIGEDVIWDVMDQHLTTEEMDLAQGLWDIYGSMEDRVVALEKLDGKDVELVKAKPFTFKGKEYRGGYAPIQFVTNNHEGLLGKVKNSIADFVKKKEQGYSANEAARGMTAQGYTEKRIGSDQRISLSPITIALGIDEVVTDLTMRVPVRDVYKILTNTRISKEIMNVIGKARYKAMIDGIASLTTSENARRMNGQIQGEATLDNFFSEIEKRNAITLLALNVKSVMMQPLSLGTALENMGGVSASKHILNVVAKQAMPWNWHKVKDKYSLAAQINPSIKHAKDNVDAHNTGGIIDTLPTRRSFGGKPLNMFAMARDYVTEVTMSIFGVVDAAIKIPVTLAAYEQYMKCDAPGQDGYEFWKMSDDEKHNAAISYAQKISESSLTHTDEINKANIQKSDLGKRIARFFNDPRNQLNTTIMSTRQLRWNFREGVRLAKEGDPEGSAKAFYSVADKTISMTAISVAMGIYEHILRSFGTPEDSEDDAILDTVMGAAKARFLGVSPILREMVFSIETGLNITTPAFNALTDISVGVKASGTLLNNYVGLLDGMEADKELTDRQLKGLLSTMSYVVGGLPINGPWRIVNAATDPNAKNVGAENLAVGIIGYFIDRATKFIEKFEDDEEMKPIVDQVKKDVAVIQMSTDEDFEISDLDLAAFRQAENPQNIWNATNSTSTAFGDYQIVEDTWADIVHRGNKADPSLKLTLDGLYDRDGKQAERGIKWLISDNARILMNKGFEPTLINIYGAHHFGAKGWIRVLNADDSASIESAFSEKAINSNSWLRGDDIKNVGDAREFVIRYISKAKFKVLNDSSVAKNTVTQ